MRKPNKKNLVAICLNLLWMVVGCAPSLVPYSLDTPPLVLVPASLANVEDGRNRFREIYCAIREDHGKALPDDRPCDEVVLRLGNEPPPTGKPVTFAKSEHHARIVIVPGIFGECLAGSISAYSDGRAHLEQLGYKTDLIPVSGRSGSQSNAKQIRDYIMEKLPQDEPLILIGYSKGTADILECMEDYPELQGRVKAIVSIAGVVGGSPLAEGIGDILRTLIEEIPLPLCAPGDGDAIVSLRPSIRLKWLAEHDLTKAYRYFSLAAFDAENGISNILKSSYNKLARIDPMNDSQVIFYDAIIPGSTMLGYVKADHWAVAMPFSRNWPLISATLINHNEFPREVLLEAVVRFVEESLEIDRRR